MSNNKQLKTPEIKTTRQPGEIKTVSQTRKNFLKTILNDVMPTENIADARIRTA